MLKFYGIRSNHLGEPERYTLSIALKESLNAALYILDYFDGDKAKTIEAIKEEIDTLFTTQGGVQKKDQNFRFLVAKWFRTKDIIEFICTSTALRPLYIAIARILNTPKAIEEKWQVIKELTVEFLLERSAGERKSQMSDPESGVNMLLQMATLLFMEQDEEMPPANLELQFVRNQFPKIIWKKQDGINAFSFPFWLPKNRYCHPLFLNSEINESISKREKSALIKTLPKIATQPDVKNTAIASFDFKELDVSAKQANIKIHSTNGDLLNEQLALFSESVSETLLGLQKKIQKKYSHEGVKHFLAILRQLSEVISKHSSTCDFDCGKHFELILKSSQLKKISQKQMTLFRNIFSELQKLEVERDWEGSTPEPGDRTCNPFIAEISQFFRRGKKLPVKKVVVDPLFLPNKSNPYRLGAHLKLIPDNVFKESSSRHALVPGLASYLCGAWMLNYPEKKGTLCKKAHEILEGCAFNVTPASRYRILNKLKSELQFMEKKRYIKNFKTEKNKSGNPWDEMFSVTAPDSLQTLIANSFTPAQTQSIGRISG